MGNEPMFRTESQPIPISNEQFQLPEQWPEQFYSASADQSTTSTLEQWVEWELALRRKK